MSDLSQANAAADIVYSLGITPRTTLSEPLTAGDTSITVTDPSAFSEGGLLVWPGSFLVYTGRISNGVSAGVATAQLDSAGAYYHPTTSQLQVGQRVIVGEPGQAEETVTITAVTVAGGFVTAFTAVFAFDHFTAGTIWESVPLFDETLAISSVVGDVITPNWEGTGYTGFQYGQPLNSEVATNLCANAIVGSAASVQKGDPLISIMAMSEESSLTATHTNQETYQMQVLYRTALLGSRGSKLDPNVWGFRQQVKARRSLRAILRTIVRNPRLITSDGIVHAEKLGPAAQRAQIDWSRAVLDETTLVFGVPVRFRVQDAQETW